MEPGKLYFFTKEAEEEYKEACKAAARRSDRSLFFNIPHDVPLDSDEEKKLIDEYNNRSFVGRLVPLQRSYNESTFKIEAALQSNKDIPLGEGIYKVMNKGEMKTINEVLKELKK